MKKLLLLLSLLMLIGCKTTTSKSISENTVNSKTESSSIVIEQSWEELLSNKHLIVVCGSISKDYVAKFFTKVEYSYYAKNGASEIDVRYTEIGETTPITDIYWGNVSYVIYNYDM